METRSNAKTSIPIAAARLYPHVADDAHGTDLPILPGPMDVSRLVVEVGARVGHVSLASESNDVDPYGVELDLEPAAARLLARQLDRAADACDVLPSSGPTRKAT